MQIKNLLAGFSRKPAPPPLLLVERRKGISNLETAARTLSRAIDYLVSEQLAGRRHPLQANRMAIALLCEAGRGIAKEERRLPARRSLNAWLRDAALFGADRNYVQEDEDAPENKQSDLDGQG
jgi:hypothetical protein